jgi:outer membrane protein assembly factor BamA
VNNLKAVYQSEGFSSVQVASSVANRGGDIVVEFRVTEGPRDVVNTLTIQGNDTLAPAQFAPGGLKVAAGQPYSQAHVEADRASIVANYLKTGYLNSSFRETATEVSKDDPHHINVVYHIYEGPKVIAGGLVTLGRAHTKQRLIDRDVADIKPGQPLTESQLLLAGSKLYDHTGVFDWAEVDPKRQITTQDAEDVVVRVHEAKRNQITYGIGFEVINRGGSIPSGTVALPNLPPIGLPPNFTTSQVTFYGPRGTFQYTRNNVGGKGDSLSFTGFAGRLDQRGAAYYIVPDFRWSPWKATTSVSADKN